MKNYKGLCGFYTEARPPLNWRLEKKKKIKLDEINETDN